MTPRPLAAVFLAVVIVLMAACARTARAEPPRFADSVGDGAQGLPGIGRVAVAVPREPRLSLAGTTGYGYTESQNGEGAHHRAIGALAVAVQPVAFFGAALSLDGRYDHHPSDANGSDNGLVGDPRLFLRAARALSSSFAIGAQVVAWAPGSQAPSIELDAVTFDGDVLVTFAPPGTGFVAAANAGYRVDRSAASVDTPARFRAGDRIALEISQFDAALLGLGASKRIAATEILAEVTWDVLLGTNAPSPTSSPLRAAAGARYHASDRIAVELSSEIVLGARPPVGPSEPLIPIDPRVTVLAGLRWTIPFTAPKTPEPEIVRPPEAPPPPTTPTVAGGAVRGRVTGEGGGAIAGARVSISTGKAERSAETGADGAFAVTDVAAGSAHLSVKAAGHDDETVEVTVTGGGTATADVIMKRTVRPVRPGQLRGLVRSFNGRPLPAKVRVEPLGIEVRTDTDGFFQVDVPPGAYQVVIESAGRAGQTRPVTVEENGVTVLNVDLR